MTLISEPTELSKALDYQADAIVSKTLVDKKSGSVTLFAFAAGQRLSEHTSPYDALVYVLEGQVTITLAGEPFTVKTGEMLLMPAGKPHGLTADTDFKMLLIMIK